MTHEPVVSHLSPEWRNRAMAVLTAATLILPSLAAAADADFENHLTGANSENTNDLTSTKTINFTITNTGAVTNDISLDLNTGGNTVTQNTTVGDVTTGDIDFAIELESVVNDVEVALPQNLDAAAASISSSNELTGANSTNTNTTTVTEETTITQTNTATINNTFDLAVDTGNNEISQNTTVGDITTGNIKGEIRVTNAANAPAPAAAPGAGGGGGAGAGAGGGGLGGPAPLLPLPTIVAEAPVIAQGQPVAQVAAAAEQPKAEAKPAAKQFFPAGANAIGDAVLMLIAAFVIVFVAELKKVFGADFLPDLVEAPAKL